MRTRGWRPLLAEPTGRPPGEPWPATGLGQCRISFEPFGGYCHLFQAAASDPLEKIENLAGDLSVVEGEGHLATGGVRELIEEIL